MVFSRFAIFAQRQCQVDFSTGRRRSRWSPTDDQRRCFRKPPKWDVIFGAHVWHDVPAGKIAAQSGPIMAAPDSFVIYNNRSGWTWRSTASCFDAIAIAAQVIKRPAAYREQTVL